VTPNAVISHNLCAVCLQRLLGGRTIMLRTYVISHPRDLVIVLSEQNKANKQI